MENISNKTLKLTTREEELMNIFWIKGPLFVRELLELQEEPKPHFNTLSTIVRGLEEKGFLRHNSFGSTYQYYPAISRDEYKQGALKNVVNKYFKDSYLGVVSSLIKEEQISLKELKELIAQVEKNLKK
ncbi:MAG: BlaI/MecI/CopY family transcriptional regulator [Bacteroidales bacterium]|nr:BlaI/MecI/CopY family transcriptional regulator [Bacteroidales bacterium]MDD4639649.1 BlaI/MecI/CopY family transcriptional regulator [Bacteroidales bacterium]